MFFHKDIDFIARHYRKGLFAIEPALYRIKGVRKKIFTLPKIVAISSFIIAIGATAAILIRNSYNHKERETEAPVIEKKSPMSVSHVLDFNDVPLTTVVQHIKLIYGVEVDNLPKNADELFVTLHYEGMALDLVETLNEILETNMKIRE